MKKIAIISYKIMFDPSEAWSNGYQFESQFADYFAAHGFEAQIISPAGGSGDRVIYLERVYTPANVAKELKQGDSAPSRTPQQIRQVQTRTAPKSFKQFVKSSAPQAASTQKLAFKRGESDLRQDVHKLPHVAFRKVKR